MVPVGSVYTIDGTQAAQVVRRLKPRVVVPMHYKTPALKIGLDGPDKFLAAAKAAGWPVLKQQGSQFNGTRASLPKQTTVVVLNAG
jgi:L-ascorbate metabolism protein UlaG (beta-lactamase superfamily)